MLNRFQYLLSTSTCAATSWVDAAPRGGRIQSVARRGGKTGAKARSAGPGCGDVQAACADGGDGGLGGVYETPTALGAGGVCYREQGQSPLDGGGGFALEGTFGEVV
jgi:hypothetical protein